MSRNLTRAALTGLGATAATIGIIGAVIGATSTAANAAYVHGTSGSDDLYGTSSADEAYGYRGHDLVYTYGGADGVYGNAGNDTLFTGAGDDSAYGGPGFDWVDPGSGSDLVLLGRSADTVNLSNDGYHDDIYCGGGLDTVVYDEWDAHDTFYGCEYFVEA